jgi:Flp pilus assembly pilin Flp
MGPRWPADEFSVEANISNLMVRLWFQEEGQDMVEYSLLLAFIALAAVALLAGIKTSIRSIWTTLSTGLSTGAA